MKLKYLKSTEYKVMRWKNGLGLTTEIALFPENSSLDQNNFQWRLSAAELNNDNSFSNFEGCDRYLTITHGLGVSLHIGQQKHLLKPPEVLRFSAEQTVTVQLVDGSVTDLGLIFKKEIVKAQFEMLTKSFESSELSRGTYIIFISQGSVEIGIEFQSPILAEPNEAVILEVEQNETTHLSTIASDECSYAWIQISEI